eukprot:5871001-Amphidinium_carterae.1
MDQDTARPACKPPPKPRKNMCSGERKLLWNKYRRVTVDPISSSNDTSPSEPSIQEGQDEKALQTLCLVSVLCSDYHHEMNSTEREVHGEEHHSFVAITATLINTCACYLLGLAQGCNARIGFLNA